MQKNEAENLKADREAKQNELKLQQAKLKELHTELEKINAKINKREDISLEDTKFMGDLGWLAALSVTIASIAANM